MRDWDDPVYENITHSFLAGKTRRDYPPRHPRFIVAAVCGERARAHARDKRLSFRLLFGKFADTDTSPDGRLPADLTDAASRNHGWLLRRIVRAIRVPIRHRDLSPTRSARGGAQRAVCADGRPEYKVA